LISRREQDHHLQKKMRSFRPCNLFYQRSLLLPA